MSNDDKLTGEAWGVIDQDGELYNVYDSQGVASINAAVHGVNFREPTVRRIRWETIDATKGTER